MKTGSKGTDLLISFDTTGSMYPVLSRVRREVRSFITDMEKEIDDLRIGIIAHGDYCDKDNPYTIRVMPFTNDVEALCKFVQETEATYGGDADECYELVLNTAANMLDWGSDRNHIMVMIGDASPHGVNYYLNEGKLNWLEETRKLAKRNVKIFPVHALSFYRDSSRNFYKSLAFETGGIYLTLDQFDEIIDLIKATCLSEFSEEKLTSYISIIRSNGRMTRTMARNLGRLQGEDDKYMDDFKRVGEEGLVPVKPGRFQAMHVDKDCDIRGFVTSNGIEFKRGRGFYELTKHETVQQYKEVIIQDRETGEMFTGTQVREKLGLQPQCDKGGVKESLSSRSTRDYRVFVQSTSINRKLIAGTTFLYEVSDFEDTGTVIESGPVTSSKVDDTADKKVKKPASTKKTSKTSTKKSSSKASKTGKASKTSKSGTDKADIPMEESVLAVTGVTKDDKKPLEYASDMLTYLAELITAINANDKIAVNTSCQQIKSSLDSITDNMK